MKAAFLLAAALLLAGCETDHKPPVQVIATPTGPATDAQIAALKADAAEQKARADREAELAQRAAGAVYGAGDANQHNPEGLPKEAVTTHLKEAASALPEATLEQKLKAEQDNARILAGELAAVQAEKGQAISENQALRINLAAIEERAKAAQEKAAEVEKAAVAERAAAAKKLQDVLDAKDNAIRAAQDEARNKAMLAQVALFNEWGAWLVGAGVLALGLAGIFGGLGALRAVGPIAALAVVCGLACFGIAQIVGQAWFKWAVLGVVALVLGICAWWVVRKYKAGTLKEAAEAKAARLTGALKTVVPVLDKAYDEASGDVKELLDNTIFKELSRLMDKDQKSVVHEVRTL